MSDTRRTMTAISDANAPGHYLISCDDGSTFTSRSFIDSPEGIRVVGSAPDGSVATDGPILTDDVRAQLAAVGVEGIPAHSPPVPSLGPVTLILGNLSAALPIAHAASPAIAAASPHHAHLAGILHGAFSALEKVLGLAGNPAVLALLPAKYQGYATAAMLVEQLASGGVNSAP